MQDDDRRQLDARGGLVALVAGVVLVGAYLVFEVRVVAFVFGILLAAMADAPGDRAGRAARMLGWVAAGAGVSWLGAELPRAAWSAALLALVAVTGGSLAQTRDARFGYAALALGLLAALEPVISHDGGTQALLAGGVVAALVVLLRDRRGDSDRPPGPDRGYAFLRGGIVAAAALTGHLLVPDHPAWAAVTALLLFGPDRAGTLTTTASRVVGTIIGGAVGIVLGIAVIDEPWLGITVLVLAFAAQVAVRPYGYTIVVVFITVAVVVSTVLVGDDPYEATGGRIAATLVGAVLALTPMAVDRWRLR